MSQTSPLHPEGRKDNTLGTCESDAIRIPAANQAGIGNYMMETTGINGDLVAQLRRLFQSESGRLLSADGSSGDVVRMSLPHVAYPGESIVVPVCGTAGAALADACEQAGADVNRLEKEGGAGLAPDEIVHELRKRRPSMLVIAHGDGESEPIRPLKELGIACRELDVLLIADISATIGKMPIRLDEWHVDAAIAEVGGCPEVPGPISLLVYNDRWEARRQGRARLRRGRFVKAEAGLEPLGHEAAIAAAHRTALQWLRDWVLHESNYE